MTSANENWLPVVGFEGLYEVSDHGRVKRNGRILAQSRAGRTRAYATVKLSKAGVVTTHYVHRLEMAAFVGPCPPGHEVCHGPGGSLDNRLDNLRYDTPQENQRDRIAHGTDDLGERNAMAKLRTEDVRAIRRSVEPQRALAARYGVTQQAISKIKNYQRWPHV